MVAFEVCPKNLVMWHEPINGTLTFCECRLSDVDTQRWWDTQTLPAVIEFV